MKNIHILILMLLSISCQEPKNTHIGQEIIDGKVSAIQKGALSPYNRVLRFPKIWVQTSTKTTEVEIPMEYNNRWKIGDSCLLIIEKYKENGK